MQRDTELMRLLLVHLRDEKEPEALKTYPEKEVVYNAALLINDGYIEGDVIRNETGGYAGCAMLSITSKGHDLLEKLEDVSMTSVPIPTEIVDSLARFKQDHPDPAHLGFVMMRFSQTAAHNQIIASARSAAGAFRSELLRADDREYHTDLYYNILTYIYGCSFGVAVFERIEQEDFNPNVSFEVGFMLALRKPVLLLKDKNLKVLHTDLIGKLYKTFDAQNIESTLPTEIGKWLQDQKLS